MFAAGRQRFCRHECSVSRISDPARLFNETIERLRSGDPAAARLLPELERFPEFGPGWLALGSLLQDSGKIDAAIMALGRAAQAMHTAPIASHRLGQCLVLRNRHDAAIAAFRHAVGIDPAFAEGWYSLGSALQDRGDHAGSVQPYRAALRAKPDLHEAAFNLGIALQESGRLEQAMDAYGAALRSRPDSLARIAQALTSGRCGTMWLHPAKLRDHLIARRGNVSGSDPDR